MTPLPVTVIVPHIPTRDEFLSKHCVPAILRNRPQEIIILEGPERPAVKRNRGIAKAASEYIYCCDDDVVVKDGTLKSLLSALESHPDAAFAYGNYENFVSPGIYFPGEEGIRKPYPWNLERLKKGNFISTMSMIRKRLFPGFDETLPSLEDWEAWIHIGMRGSYGVYVDQLLHESHHFDKTISGTVDPGESIKRVREKHGFSL